MGSNGSVKAGVLSLDQINAVRAKARNRGVAGKRLVELMESDDAGVNVFEIWGAEFAGKNPNGIAQSFRKAAKEAKIEDKLTITTHDEQVYILVNERVEKLEQEAAAA